MNLVVTQDRGKWKAWAYDTINGVIVGVILYADSEDDARERVIREWKRVSGAGASRRGT